MSVILRKDGEIRLYTKGADNVIYDRLKGNHSDVKSKTQEHLNVSSFLFFPISSNKFRKGMHKHTAKK